MARTRRRHLQEDDQDDAAETSADVPAQATGPQVAEGRATTARSTAPVTRRRSQAKASRGKGKAKGSGRARGGTSRPRPRPSAAAAAARTRYDPTAMWRAGDPKLESWQFLDQERTGVLKMTNPRHSHDRHFYILPDDERPVLKSRGTPKEDRPGMTREDMRTAASWSHYFYDALYGHPQAIPRPARQTKDCHILGLFNGDLIIDATSRSRPRGMYWTFNQGTQMLQHVKPCGSKRPSGPIKEQEFSINQVGRFIGNKGPAPGFGRFPPPAAFTFPIEADDNNEISSFDGGGMAGDRFIRDPRTARVPRQYIEPSRQIKKYLVTVHKDGNFTTIAMRNPVVRKRTRFDLDGLDDDSSDFSSDFSVRANASGARERKRRAYVANSLSEASSLFLAAYSTPIYETSRRAAFDTVQRLKRKPEDAVDPRSTKRSRILLFPDEEVFLAFGDGADVAKVALKTLDPFFETFGLSIYKSAREVAFDAEKKRKAQDELDEPPRQRSRAEEFGQGERERFAALRGAVGTRMATAIQTLLFDVLRTNTADFRRRKKIQWSPSLLSDNDDDGAGYGGIEREPEEIGSPQQEEDNDDNEGNKNIPVAGNNTSRGEFRRDWEGLSPVSDEDEDEDVITTDHLTPDGQGGFKKRGEGRSVVGKCGRKGGEKEPATDQDGASGNKPADQSRQRFQTYNWKSEGPLPERPVGNQAYECPPLRPEDDYMMSGAIGPESPVRSPAPHNTEDSDEGDDNTEASRDMGRDCRDYQNSSEKGDEKSDPDDSGDDEIHGRGNQMAPIAGPQVSPHSSREVSEPESPIDQVILDQIAAEQSELEVQRIIARNIAELNDPVARERVRQEEEARRAAQQAEQDLIEQSLLEDEDNGLTDFDNSDEEDEDDSEGSEESADSSTHYSSGSDNEGGAGEGEGAGGGGGEEDRQEDADKEEEKDKSREGRTHVVEDKSNDGSGTTSHSHQTEKEPAVFEQDTTKSPAPTSSPNLKGRSGKGRQAALLAIRNRMTTQNTTMTLMGQYSKDDSGKDGKDGRRPHQSPVKTDTELAEEFYQKRMAELAAELDQGVPGGNGTTPAGEDGTADVGQASISSSSELFEEESERSGEEEGWEVLNPGNAAANGTPIGGGSGTRSPHADGDGTTSTLVYRRVTGERNAGAAGVMVAQPDFPSTGHTSGNNAPDAEGDGSSEVLGRTAIASSILTSITGLEARHNTTTITNPTSIIPPASTTSIRRGRSTGWSGRRNLLAERSNGWYGIGEDSLARIRERSIREGWRVRLIVRSSIGVPTDLKQNQAID